MDALQRRDGSGDEEALRLEQALLGAVLVNNAALGAMPFLEPQHFAEPIHGRVFAAVRRLAQGGRATPATVAFHLPEQTVGGLGRGAFLARLAAEAVTIVNAPDYARLVFELAMRRELAAIAARLAEEAAARSIGRPALEAIAAAEAALTAANEAIRSAEEGAPASFAGVVAAAEARAAHGAGLAGPGCGFAAVDAMLGGFAPGALVVIAGRPGMGKTMLGLSLARRAAHGGAGSAFVSLEMTHEQVALRLIADEAAGNGGPAYAAMARGRAEPGAWQAGRRAAERLAGLPLAIIERGNRLADLPAHVLRARRALEARGKRLDFLLVDYLGLIRPSERYAGNKVHETGEISAALKELARRERIAVFALHQLNRALERSEEKRPSLADLRDSGNVEQDADMVCFVYREHYYLSRPNARLPPAEEGDTRSHEERRMRRMIEVEHEMELIVAKNRQGPTGTVRLWCDVARNAVRDEGG